MHAAEAAQSKCWMTECSERATSVGRSEVSIQLADDYNCFATAVSGKEHESIRAVVLERSETAPPLWLKSRSRCVQAKRNRMLKH